jgi:hypothetical protein
MTGFFRYSTVLVFIFVFIYVYGCLISFYITINFTICPSMELGAYLFGKRRQSSTARLQAVQISCMYHADDINIYYSYNYIYRGGT